VPPVFFVTILCVRSNVPHFFRSPVLCSSFFQISCSPQHREMDEISDEERAWRQYKMEKVKLNAQTVDELKVRVLSKDPNVKFSGKKKDDLIEILLPPVARPIVLSFQPGSVAAASSPSEPPPPKVTEADLLQPNGKYKTVKELEPMLILRGLPKKAAKKDMSLQRLRDYDPENFRPPSQPAHPMAAYIDRPQGNCRMARLYDMVTAEIDTLQADGKEALATELTTLRPHILQHLENSFDYHILGRRDKSNFDFGFQNGVNHWQGYHYNCVRKNACPQEGWILSPALVAVVTAVLQESSHLVDKTTNQVW